MIVRFYITLFLLFLGFGSVSQIDSSAEYSQRLLNLEFGDYKTLYDKGNMKVVNYKTDSVVISGVEKIYQYLDAYIIESSDSIGYYSNGFLVFPYGSMSCGVVSIRGKYGVKRNENGMYSFIHVDGSEMFPEVYYDDVLNCFFEEGYSVVFKGRNKYIIDSLNCIKAKMRVKQEIELPYLKSYWKIGRWRMRLFSLETGEKIYSTWTYNIYDHEIEKHDYGYLIGKKKNKKIKVP
jgi:hypothetical protein